MDHDTLALLSLEEAVIVVPDGLSGPEARAVTMLVEEVERRSQIRWPIARKWPAEAVPVVAVGPASAWDWPAGSVGQAVSLPLPDEEGRLTACPTAPEGYRITVRAEGASPAVFVIGSDARGVLFGVGRLLRSLRLG